MDIQGNPRLSVRGLNKTLKHKSILKGLYLDVFPGEAVFLLGEEAAATTCLLSIIAGRESPCGGHVYFEEKKITNDWLPKEKLMYIPERGKHYQFGRTGQRLARWQVKNPETTTTDVMAAVGLTNDLNTLCRELSPDKSQMLSLAHALMRRPRLLLIDRAMDDFPTEQRAALLLQLTKTSNETGMTVLISTCHGEDALMFGSRTAIMAEGRIIQQDAPKAVYDHPNSLASARLTGDCVLLKGKATAVEDDRVLMDINGLNITCFSENWITPGESLILCLRPEYINWGKKADPNDPQPLPAVLKDAKKVPGGVELIFFLRNGLELRFQKSDIPNDLLEVDRDYLLWFDTKRCPLLYEAKINAKDDQ